MAVELSFGQKFKSDPRIEQIRLFNHRRWTARIRRNRARHIQISRIWTKTFVQTQKLNRNSCSTRGLNRIELFDMSEIQFCDHVTWNHFSIIKEVMIETIWRTMIFCFFLFIAWSRRISERFSDRWKKKSFEIERLISRNQIN
jgi:hypothetical protein